MNAGVNGNITAFLKRRVLPNLPYLLIYWFANKFGEAYRLAAGRDFLHKFTGSMRTLNAAMAHVMPSFVLFDVTVGFAGAVIVYAIVYVKRKNAKKYRKEVLCYKGRQWRIAEKPCSHGVCGTNGRTGKLA